MDAELSYFKIAYCFAIAAMLGACTHLPASGPGHRAIEAGATVAQVGKDKPAIYDYVLLEVGKGLVKSLAAYERQTIIRTYGGSGRVAPAVRLGAGDVLEVSVFEAGTGGLFLPPGTVRSGNFLRLPQQTVSRAGTITVPYAGTIRVASRSRRSVEREIEQKLAQRAIEPKVILTVVEQNSAAVTVVGDALSQPNKFKLTSAGDRVLDVISKSGGLKFPGYEVFVTLQRRSHKGTVHFPTLVNVPKANIFVYPGDTLYVFRSPRTFIAVGALGSANQTSGLTGLYTFGQEKLSLNEAVAKAGGFADTRANPAQVFLYRVEPRRALEQMGVDLRKFDVEQRYVPTVYRANFRDPSSFFFAKNFKMRNKDIIYVANSDSTEVEKFLAHVSTITAAVSGVAADAKLTRDVIVGWGSLATLSR